MVAVGSYMRVLREHQGLSQAGLAERVGVTGNTIYRIEAGRQEPRGKQLAALLNALCGRTEDFEYLRDKATTAAEGQELALRILSEQERDAVLVIANTDPKRAALLRRIARLTSSDELRARIEGYLDALEQGVS